MRRGVIASPGWPVHLSVAWGSRGHRCPHFGHSHYETAGRAFQGHDRVLYTADISRQCAFGL